MRPKRSNPKCPNDTEWQSVGYQPILLCDACYQFKPTRSVNLLEIAMQKCETEKCTRDAFYRYTWPGKEEKFVCAGHAGPVVDAARAAGVRFEMTSLVDLRAKMMDGRTAQ